MKTVFGLGLSLFILQANAQSPVMLTYNAKKIAEKKYEIIIEASIEEGWHLYSQKQPQTAIGVPTKIKFNKNPLIVINGAPNEVGLLEQHVEKTLGIESWQYSEKVAFKQSVTLKANAKTNITGTITYQVCTDERCMPPKTISFSIPVQ